MARRALEMGGTGPGDAMIRYALTCAAGHAFESWFQSAEAFDKLRAAALVECALCGSSKVEKALMAPSVALRQRPEAAPQGESPAAATESASQAASAAPPSAEGPLSRPHSAAEAALRALRRQIEANSEYVGMNFAAEARAMHDGSSPERAIYGEARPEEARKLIEDGVPVAPLPFLPGRKSN